MSTLEQVRQGFRSLLDQVSEGWSHLRDLAGNALTHFTPARRTGEVETVADQIAQASPRWGLLTTEVQETDDEVIVRLEAPGMESEDFDLSVTDGYLVVRGEKRVEDSRKEGSFYIMECAYGQFERAIPLPAAVDESRARARYRRGVLTVTLPRQQGARRRRIKVQAR